MTGPSLALSATCHCGAVHVQIPHAPDYINECNCSLCDSHGVWWGYYPPDNVVVTGETRGYRRADRETPAVTVHFCGTCGCTTHWALTEAHVQNSGGANDRMGVNMRLFGRTDLAGVELRFPDGRGWDGVGEFGFVKEAVVL